MTDETNEAPKELREALDRANARADEAESGLKQFQAQTFFEKAGLGEKQASLFLQANPEVAITEEAVGTFIKEYGFQPPATAETPPPEGTPPADAGLGSLSNAGGAAQGAAPAAQPKMSKTDFDKLLVDNPQEAAKAYVEGRVERNPANVQARDLVKKGIIDH